MYYIVQFAKSAKHRTGTFNRTIKQIGPLYPNRYQAEAALFKIMDTNRVSDIFLRIDWNVSPNPIAYADLDGSGGVVRFRRRDNYHFSPQITLAEFGQRLARLKPKARIA